MKNQQKTKNQQQQFDCPHCSNQFSSQKVLEAHLDAVNWEKNDKSASMQKLPVKRDYNWDKKIPENIPEYKESGEELKRIKADIENRETTGNLPRYLISGDTGAGKTHLAQKIAEDRNIPIFTIQGKYSLDESDLLGSPMLVDEKTVWSDGTLTKALLASQEREIMLLVDELNRSPPESKGVLFSALDDRCKIELDARGGEEIQGNPENIIVMGTINEGSDYAVQELDKAEKRRFGRKFEVQHLGINYPDKEAEIISERSPLEFNVAQNLVKAANEIRNLVPDDSNMVNSSVPTSSLLDWAKTASAYSLDGMDNAIMKSALDTVVRPIYDRETTRDDVSETIRDHLDGAPIDSEEFEDWKTDSSKEKASNSDSEDNKEYDDPHKCPNCGKKCKSAQGVKLHQSKSNCYA